MEYKYYSAKFMYAFYMHQRSKPKVLNNGEAPQCSCTVEECTNMESSLPQNHLEHTTNARVHKTKENHSTCTKDMVEP